MKLVVFNGKKLGAIIEDGSVIDLHNSYLAYLKHKKSPRPKGKAELNVPNNLLEFIKNGEKGLEAATKGIEYVKSGNSISSWGEKLLYNPDEVKLNAPLPSKATRIAMAGANFYDHSLDATWAFTGERGSIEELKEKVESGEDIPWGFWKLAKNVVAPNSNVYYPDRTQRLDYEVEVAVIIGKKGKDISEEKAMEYVYGYTILNDLSIRDGGRSRGGLFLAKNFDGCAPMGPCIVTVDEIKNPYKLKMKQWVNGELRQDGSMESMIRSYEWWISYLSRDMTLYPGDMLCGGTCSGTAMDSTRRIDGKTDPKLFLKPGDKLEAYIENIGTLKTNIVSKS